MGFPQGTIPINSGNVCRVGGVIDIQKTENSKLSKVFRLARRYCEPSGTYQEAINLNTNDST